MSFPPDVTDDALRSGLHSLSLVLADAAPPESALTQVVRIAAGAIVGADGAGLTLFIADRAEPAAASTSYVGEVELIQATLLEGPGISARASGQTMCSGSLAGDARWPRFGPRVANLGAHPVRSALSLRLESPPGVFLGVLDLYAHQQDAFTADSARLGEQFAASASVVVSNLQTLSDMQRQVSALKAAVNPQATIDQAIGVILNRTGGTATQALDSMRLTSQKENRKLSVVAAQVLATAVGRARARHAQL